MMNTETLPGADAPSGGMGIASAIPPNPLEWHDGAPPHIGWWETCVSLDVVDASTYYPDDNLWHWCWWNGTCWSSSVDGRATAQRAALSANVPTRTNLPIYWHLRWPDRALVARINPETGEVTGAGPMPDAPHNWLAVGEIYGHGEGTA